MLDSPVGTRFTPLDACFFSRLAQASANACKAHQATRTLKRALSMLVQYLSAIHLTKMPICGYLWHQTSSFRGIFRAHCGRHGATFRSLWCWPHWSPQLVGLHQSGCYANAAIAAAPRGGGSTCCADLRGQAAVDCRPEPQDAPGNGPSAKRQRSKMKTKITEHLKRKLKDVEKCRKFQLVSFLCRIGT